MRTKIGWTFYYSAYPKSDCKVNVRMPPCLGRDEEGFEKYATYFHVRLEQLGERESDQIITLTVTSILQKYEFGKR